MTCLRKISSLRRIVMVTTLAKQSVRAILELARPIENGLGHPFMPIRACIVDTLPTGPHFEIVILMERRLMHRLTQPWFIKMMEEEESKLANTKDLETMINNDTTENTERLRKNPLAKPELVEKAKALLTKKISKAVKSGSDSPVKGKIKLKRDHSPEIIEIKKVPKKIEKPGFKPGQQGKFGDIKLIDIIRSCYVRSSNQFFFINQMLQLRKRIGFMKTQHFASILYLRKKQGRTKNKLI